ncbi:hypothetical protein J7J47_01915, partial [Halomonas sp. ISL-60]|nr:hypothetical protein [Halomonas sp. ISL-60]
TSYYNPSLVNGEMKLLNALALLETGVTYVPLRFVVEVLGLDMEW